MKKNNEELERDLLFFLNSNNTDRITSKPIRFDEIFGVDTDIDCISQYLENSGDKTFVNRNGDAIQLHYIYVQKEIKFIKQ